MPADFSRYVNLRIHDVDAGSLYRQMIEVARTVMPEFNLRRGTVEDSIFQSSAYTAAIATNAINRVPDGLMQGIVSLFGFQRNFGSRATITATATLYGTSGGAIPVGTQFRYRYVDSANGTFSDFLFVTSEDTVITASANPTGTLQLTCDAFGEIPAADTGTTLLPLSVDTDINTVTVASFSNGTNALTDAEYLDSAKTFLESISTTYVTAKQLESAILSNFPYVARCKVFDLMDPNGDRGVQVFLTDTNKNVNLSSYKGYVGIFVYGFGRALSSNELGNIQSFAASSSMAGLDIEVVNFQTVTPTIAVTASYDSSFSQTSTTESIKLSLAEYLSPDFFPYEEISIASPRLRSTVLSSRLLSTVPGLVSVDSITLSPPTADLTYVIAATGSMTGDSASFDNTSTQDCIVTTFPVGSDLVVTAVSGNGTTVTYTTSTTHNFLAGNVVNIVGITTTTAYNGTFTIASVPSPTTFAVTRTTTGTGTISGDETATKSLAHGLSLGQRIKITDGLYGNASIRVKSIPSFDRFTIGIAFTSASSRATMHRYFNEGSGTQQTLNFLNRGVLPNVSIDDITATLSAETL